KVPRVECVVAQEFEQLTVKLVRARACGDIDNRTRVAPVLSAEGRVVGLDLRHCIDRRLERDLVLHHVVQVDTVDLKVDRVLTIAGRVNCERTLPPKRCGQETVLRRSDRAGYEQAEVNEVTAVERDFLYRALVDYRAD